MTNKKRHGPAPGKLNQFDEAIQTVLKDAGRFMSTSEIRAITALSSSTVHRAVHKLGLVRIESVLHGKVVMLYGIDEFPLPDGDDQPVKHIVTDHTLVALKLARESNDRLFGQLEWATRG